MTTRWAVLVRGRVQGVGFRWFVRELAVRLGVRGWVRNLPGGAVELEAQGETGRLKEFLGELETGHPYARVEACERRDVPSVEGESEFIIRG